MKLITFEEFIETYKPVVNSVEDLAPYGGYMFETYGEDLKKVMDTDNKYIWTLVDSDNENSWILPEYHFVNRVGYFITTVSYKGEDVQVNMNEMLTIGEAKSACIEFIEEQLGIPVEQFEDKIHDWFSTYSHQL